MEKVETYKGDYVKIIEHGNSLDLAERIQYYEAVIYDLYELHGAFDRDKYMGENTLKKKLEREILIAKEEIAKQGKNSDVIKINAQISMSDLTRIFEPMREVEIIKKDTETKRLLRQFYTTKELDEKEEAYNKRSNDIMKNERTTKSYKLIDYVEKFIEMNFRDRKEILMRLEKYISNLQK